MIIKFTFIRIDPLRHTSELNTMEPLLTDTLVSEQVNLRPPSQNPFELPYKLSVYLLL